MPKLEIIIGRRSFNLLSSKDQKNLLLYEQIHDLKDVFADFKCDLNNCFAIIVGRMSSHMEGIRVGKTAVNAYVREIRALGNKAYDDDFEKMIYYSSLQTRHFENICSKISKHIFDVEKEYIKDETEIKSFEKLFGFFDKKRNLLYLKMNLRKKQLERKYNIKTEINMLWKLDYVPGTWTEECRKLKEEYASVCEYDVCGEINEEDN